MVCSAVVITWMKYPTVVGPRPLYNIPNPSCSTMTLATEHHKILWILLKGSYFVDLMNERMREALYLSVFDHCQTTTIFNAEWIQFFIFRSSLSAPEITLVSTNSAALEVWSLVFTTSNGTATPWEKEQQIPPARKYLRVTSCFVRIVRWFHRVLLSWKSKSR